MRAIEAGIDHANLHPLRACRQMILPAYHPSAVTALGGAADGRTDWHLALDRNIVEDMAIGLVEEVERKALLWKLLPEAAQDLIGLALRWQQDARQARSRSLLNFVAELFHARPRGGRQLVGEDLVLAVAIGRRR